MTYTAIVTAAKTGLTHQSRLPVKKAPAVKPALKLVGAPAYTQPLPHLKQPHASSIRCPAPAASISSQRKVSPSAVVVPSARQTESIAKHLKRSQSVSKAHPVAVQQRLKPSHPTSVKPSLRTRSLLPSQRAPSMSARKADKPSVDQVAEALCSLRVSSPESTAQVLPRSRSLQRAATPPQKPTTRPVLRSCLVKKNVVLSARQRSQPRRPLKRVKFGISSTRTFPRVRVFDVLDEDRPKVQGSMVSLLEKSTTLANSWVRPDDPIEEPRKHFGDASALARYCHSCRNVAARDAFEMHPWFSRPWVDRPYYPMPEPRCENCPSRTPTGKTELNIYMECPLDEYFFDSDDSSFDLDPEPLVDSVDVCKVTELVSTSTAMARSEACKCTDDSFDLPTNFESIDEPIDEPYDWENDPDIF